MSTLHDVHHDAESVETTSFCSRTYSRVMQSAHAANNRTGYFVLKQVRVRVGFTASRAVVLFKVNSSRFTDPPLRVHAACFCVYTSINRAS